MIKFTTKVNPCRSLLLHAAVFAVCNRDQLVSTKPLSNTKLIPKVIEGLPLIYKRLTLQCELIMKEDLGLADNETKHAREKKNMLGLADDPLFTLMPNPLPRS